MAMTRLVPGRQDGLSQASGSGIVEHGGATGETSLLWPLVSLRPTVCSKPVSLCGTLWRRYLSGTMRWLFVRKSGASYDEQVEVARFSARQSCRASSRQAELDWHAALVSPPLGIDVLTTSSRNSIPPSAFAAYNVRAQHATMFRGLSGTFRAYALAVESLGHTPELPRHAYICAFGGMQGKFVPRGPAGSIATRHFRSISVTRCAMGIRTFSQVHIPASFIRTRHTNVKSLEIWQTTMRIDTFA